MTLFKNNIFIQTPIEIDSTEKFLKISDIDTIQNCIIYVRKGRAAINVSLNNK